MDGIMSVAQRRNPYISPFPEHKPNHQQPAPAMTYHPHKKPRKETLLSISSRGFQSKINFNYNLCSHP
jgi:hypothetical protein